MTGYTYRWVSAILKGEPNWEALKRAAERGWVPVPEHELTELHYRKAHEGGLTLEQTKNFRLHRMPLEQSEQRRADLRELNEALLDPRVQVLIMRRNIGEEIRKLRAGGTAVGAHWDPEGSVFGMLQSSRGTAVVPEGAAKVNQIDEDLLRKVEIAYNFLHERGLA